VNLTYWGLWEDESVMNGVIADFESKNPNIKITYKKNLKDGYRGRLSGRLAKTGATEDVPDIYRIHNSWIPMFKDYLSPVPTKIALNIGLENDYFDVYKNDLKEEGQWLSVPLMYDRLF
jgi:multiple sugar transport system substrate-binding protein